MAVAIVKLEDVWYRYPGKETWVLKSVNLSLFPGSLALVVGATGSGKSTLFQLVGGLLDRFPGFFKGKVALATEGTDGEKVLSKCNDIALLLQDPATAVRLS